MKSVGMALVTLVAATGAFAYPLDIENDARWLVLESLPEQYRGQEWGVDFRQLRSRDLTRGETSVAAVCGTLDFRNSDDGLTNFIVFYADDGKGAVIPIGRPFFYGTGGDQTSDPQRRITQVVCGDGREPMLAIKAAR
jgi:hypothetical protein